VAITGGLILLAGVGANEARKARKETAKENKKLRALEQAQVADNAARSRRQQIREQRAASAKIENTAAASGQLESSAVISSIAGVQAQTNEGIGQINQAVGLGQMQSRLQENIFNAQQPSDLAIAVDVLGAGLSSYGANQKPKKGV
jgi:outer membrane receptor for Fe3+-dicitrate